MYYYRLLQAGKGASGCIYYGFGLHENSVYCREGYVVSIKLNVLPKIFVWYGMQSPNLLHFFDVCKISGQYGSTYGVQKKSQLLG